MMEAETLLTDLQFYGMKQSLQYRLSGWWSSPEKVDIFLRRLG